LSSLRRVRSHDDDVRPSLSGWLSSAAMGRHPKKRIGYALDVI
jgi:hypothetical protein